MRVWDGLSSSSSISFDQNPPEPPIAYMTENANLTRALLIRLAALNPISFFDKTSVASIDLRPSPAYTTNTALNLSSYPHLTLSSGHTLAARLLVGADGLNSSARTFAGISSRGWDYDRHGVVATVKLSTREHYDSTPSTRATAYQRFLPSGPIALLALPNGFATLVWTATPAQATRLKALTSPDLAAMINAAFRLEPVDINYMFTIPSGQASELSWRESVTRIPTSFALPDRVQDIQSHSVASFPLRFRHADTYISSRTALVGDAAHTIHPLAGQGLNMGIGDVSALVTTIEDTVAHGGDIGVEMNLEGYSSKVYARNARMLGVVDKLHWLYRMEGWLGVQVRGWGLKGVDRLPGLKEVLMRAASGGEIFS
ncbi:putative ubiquinone biosynthesis monooxygenase [Lobaria immixta]|nr:putative ubiquinone biosynthesis monooxygenase [Lobaria immixta]